MHLIFDFDGTITEKDTIGELASAAIAFQKSRGTGDLQETWDQVVKSYVDDWVKYKDTYYIPEHARLSLDNEVEFLRGMKDAEETSLERIQSSGVFSGLETSQLFEMGADAVKSGKIFIRDGFKELVELARRQNWKVAVISVNWSAAFIRGVLQPIDIPVVANEVSGSGKVEGPAFLGGTMTNSEDKLRCLEHILESQGGDKTKMLYFGDSTTDMECLLCGGVAISADETCSLIKTLRRVGSPVPHIEGAPSRAAVSWARDFYEVLKSGRLPA
ncbi:CTO1 family protein C17G9.12c [Paramyrothecium foliicola]|nr:CTO1 family protein C17G9.12c [Paramyrothecium foliicola]